MRRFDRRFNSMNPDTRPFDSSSDEEMEDVLGDHLGIQACASAPTVDDAFADFDYAVRDTGLCRSLSANFGQLPAPAEPAFPPGPGFSCSQQWAPPTQAFSNFATFTSFDTRSSIDARLPQPKVDPIDLRARSASIPFPVDETMEDVYEKTPPASPSSSFLMDLDESSQNADHSHGFMATKAEGMTLQLPKRTATLGSTSPSRFIEGSCTFRGVRPPTPEAQAPPPPTSRPRSGAVATARMDQLRSLQEMQRQLRQKEIEEQEMSPQRAKPQYRRGDGSQLVPKKKPRLKRKDNKNDDETRDVFRCQSMPTTELELQFNRQELHDPLPTLPKHSSTRSISSQTLVKLIDGHYKEQIDGYFIIDCRFPYEFKGGHIKGAQNIPPSDSEKRLTEMFMERASLLGSKRLAIVFHCEFSSKRGPSAYKLLRGMDRTANFDRYPKMFFPYMYILEGGYKEFFSQYPKYCYPMCYVTMKDKKYAQELKHNTRLKRISEKQRSLSCSNFNLASLRESIGRTRSTLSQSTQVAGSSRDRARTMRAPLSESQRYC